MNEFNPHRPGEHEEIALLLPWYVNQTLEDGELARVRAHLRHCLVCRREVQSLRALSTTLAEAPLPEPVPKAAFARLQRRLPPRPAPVHGRPPWRGSRFPLPRAALAAAASLLLVAALAGVGFQVSQPTAFYTLASPPPTTPAGGEIRLVFAQQLPQEQIDALLRHIGGRIVAGPNAMGAVAIRLDEGGKPVQAAALAFLRQQKGVVLAEPIIPQE